MAASLTDLCPRGRSGLAPADRLDKPDEAAWALAERDKLDASIQACAWDGDRFIWAIVEDGTVYGSRDAAEGALYLNTQVWAVISGAATPEQAARCMNTVNDQLATPYGLMLCAPPFVVTSIDVMRAVVFNPGVKENAGIFNHTQGWAVIAECLLGHGDRAYEYYRAAMPAAYNDRAAVRQIEPYVQGQTTYSTFSPRPGNTRTSWLTGAAAWAHFSATQYVLGLRPEIDGLRIDPCIPSTWDRFTATRRFRGKTIEIEVANPHGICGGVKTITLNGEALPDNLVPATSCRVTIASRSCWDRHASEWHERGGDRFRFHRTFRRKRCLSLATARRAATWKSSLSPFPRHASEWHERGGDWLRFRRTFRQETVPVPRHSTASSNLEK